MGVLAAADRLPDLGLCRRASARRHPHHPGPARHALLFRALPRDHSAARPARASAPAAELDRHGGAGQGTRGRKRQRPDGEALMSRVMKTAALLLGLAACAAPAWAQEEP